MRNAASNNQEVLKGRIERVFYSGPTFSAGRIETPSGSMPFAGKIYAQEGEYMVLRGAWASHPKFGKQFQVTAVEYDLDLDPEGLANYLTNNPNIKGIGPAKAKLLVKHFADSFEQTLLERPDAMVKVGVSKKAVDSLRAEWLKNKNENAVMTWLSAFGLTHHQTKTLTEKYGANCLSILKGDPFILIQEIRGFGFKKVDKIARKLGTAKEHPQRIRAALLFLAREALDNGHCWTDRDDLIEEANDLLVMDVLGSRQRIAVELDGLIVDGVLSAVAGRHIALPAIVVQEKELAAIFRQAHQPHPHKVEPEAVDASLSDKQREALEMALRHSISLICGGAGSGKSYTIARIVEVCTRSELNILLAAPTGKAAKRMEECLRATGLESLKSVSASTLHRLLGYDGKRFAHDADFPLRGDVLIVDEVSMVDVPLAWQLFQAVDLSKTAVVLVGDHNQLPPVGPGNVLRDLLLSKAVPTVVLDKVHRQAGALKENSIAVLSGVVRPTSAPENGRCRAWYLVNNLPTPEEVRAFLFRTISEQLGPFGFDIVQDVQVLTPTHKGPIGTAELNIALQRLIQRDRFGVAVPAVDPNKRPPILLHDKVIQTRNNYDLGVMNGSIGIVRGAGEDLLVDFDGQMVTYERGSNALADLQLAYALTVHKTQGSEFRCAVVIAHKAHSFMHHRTLLYTAVTRAKETCIILGDQWGVKNCAAQQQVDRRRTFLGGFLAAREDSCR